MRRSEWLASLRAGRRAGSWGSFTGSALARATPPFRSSSSARTWASAPSSTSDALRRAIGEIDDYLSARAGVRPYCDGSDCLFRLAIVPAPGAIRLTDGCRIKPGDLIGEIHLWNEHIPAVSRRGPDLAWARHMSHQIKSSLMLLADAVASQPAWRDIRACRARTNFVGLNESGESLTRVVGRFGFEDVDEGCGTLPSRLHEALENVLIGALVWTHNPQAFRRDKLIRQRRSVWISRARLMDLHGSAHQG